jgi:alkanesulfonate monooxygenase SsuD/methylene tetrahydromethanopterin reductase-like flavin-dependent oxidoreductase (luciferase family)
MVNEAIWIAMIAAVGGVVTGALSPWLLLWQANRNKLAERLQDQAERAEVARQAREAAKLLLEANKKVADTAERANEKLDEIHTLVNSNMTAAIQSEFDATTRELAMMLEVIELKRATGKEPSVETLAAVEATRAKIAELQSTLIERGTLHTEIQGT